MFAYILSTVDTFFPFDACIHEPCFCFM